MSSVGVLDGAIAPQENVALYGHNEALDFLARAYRSGRIHHAVLLEGPQGIGKATLAFRFANHVLSHPDPSMAPEEIAPPDPQSPVFREIASGASHHVLHLTRPVDEKTGRVKSAITVDEVRRTARLFGRTTGTDGWRIVIVDPADDMNRNAANALLKMLEEPPKRALFLLVSHAPGRLLATIRSRCLPLRLMPPGEEDLMHAFQRLPAGAALDPERRREIVARAEGSLSRAILLANYGGLDIVEAFERAITEPGAKARMEMHALADVLAARDREETFRFFCEHFLDWVSDEARAAALAGDSRTAAAYAALAQRALADIATADAYNLDRKQLVLSLFSALSELRAP